MKLIKSIRVKPFPRCAVCHQDMHGKESGTVYEDGCICPSCNKTYAFNEYGGVIRIIRGTDGSIIFPKSQHDAQD